MSTSLLISSVLIVVVVLVGWRLQVHRWRRPQFRPPNLPQQLPADWVVDDPAALARRLAEREAMEPRIIPGAEGLITLADPQAPRKTPVCFLYLHGLSACRQETSPVTELLAARAGANAVYARVAGHGMGARAMSEVDGAAWLESIWEYWLMARNLGEQVVVVSTSTGSAYAVWLLEQVGVREKVRALLCMAPNFKVRNRYAFLLTWPGADYWLPQLVSSERRWHSLDPRQEKYWSTNYGNAALIQMQMILDDVQHAPIETFDVPLMVQCSPDDPVVDAQFAHRYFHRWGGEPKEFRWISVGPDESPHVFVGDIMSPQRNEDVIQHFEDFLQNLPQ